MSIGVRLTGPYTQRETYMLGQNWSSGDVNLQRYPFMFKFKWKIGTRKAGALALNLHLNHVLIGGGSVYEGAR